MTKPFHRLRQFLGELKRRRVYRVAVAYAIVAAGVWQVADVVFPALALPDVALTIMIVLALAGFPLAVVLAWAFDLTPEGVVPTRPVGANGTGPGQAASRAAREAPAGGTAAPPFREGAGGVYADTRARTPGGLPDSVAVLPFVNMSRDEEDQYLCDGMTEELINALARVDGLEVAARSSCFAYKARGGHVREIGRDLGVGAVLEGRVRRSGDELHVTVQLVGVEDGYHLWYEAYDRETEDIFAILDDIAGSVAETLKDRLAAGRPGTLVRQGTRSLAAYESYLKGRYFWRRRTATGLRASVDHFRRAVDQDPAFMQAHAGLADAYVLLGVAEYGLEPPTDVMPRAEAAARRALEIDPGSAGAQTTVAHVTYAWGWDWEAADLAFRRAIDLDPSYAFSHHWYACFLSAMGRHDEAVEEELTARRLEPQSLIINRNVGTVLFYAGRHDEALRAYRRALELGPTFTRTHFYYGLALKAGGHLEEALEELRIAVDSDPTNTVLRASLGNALGRAGETREAAAILEGLDRIAEEDRYVPALCRAIVLLGMQRHDDALDWLEQALEERSSWLVAAGVDPLFDGVREDPRFRKLLERVGLP